MKKLLAFAAMLTTVVAVCVLPVLAQRGAAPAAGQAAGQAPANAAPRVTQGGTGPIKMLLITKTHGFEREPFYQMYDSFGADVTWMHVEQPAAEKLLSPKFASMYNVAVFYDLDGSQRELGRLKGGTNGEPAVYAPPPADLQANLKGLLQQGKGMVFTHHAL